MPLAVVIEYHCLLRIFNKRARIPQSQISSVGSILCYLLVLTLLPFSLRNNFQIISIWHGSRAVLAWFNSLLARSFRTCQLLLNMKILLHRLLNYLHHIWNRHMKFQVDNLVAILVYPRTPGSIQPCKQQFKQRIGTTCCQLHVSGETVNKMMYAHGYILSQNALFQFHTTISRFLSILSIIVFLYAQTFKQDT